MASTISTSTSTWLPGQSPVHVPEIDIAISPLTGGDTDFDALLASFSEGGKGSSGNQCLQQQQHVDVLTSGGGDGEEAALKASARDFDHFLGQMNTDDADADAVKQQQHRKPTAAPTTMTGQKRSAAAAAEEEAVAEPAPAPAGRQPRRAATRAALALEAAMSPSSLADEMDEDGNHADEHEEEDAASDNGSDYDEDDDASVSASATRASAQRRNRTNTASSAAATKKSGRTSTGGSTSRRSAGGRDSGSSSLNDPNRNARLAKENRERKKQYIAGLEATIEELRAQCRQHEQKQAELRRQADLVSAENATLRTTLAHQQAFAPIVAAMQAVPGLSFTAPAVAADANSSNNKRPRVGTSATATATPTVVPLTFNVYLNPAANQ